MTQSEYLSQYKNVKERIRYNREKIIAAEHTAREYGSSRIYACTSEYQDRLYEETEELVKLMYEIERAVDRCPCSETEREVLHRRYILCEKWSDIAAEMLYSLQHLHRLNNRALKKIRVPV